MTDIDPLRLYLSRIDCLRADNERLRFAIQATASEGTYDEIAIRKAVSFELAELIVDARRALEHRS